MQQINTMEKKISELADIQKVFEKITGENDINKAFQELIKDYFKAKIFQLKIQITQLETKWRLTYEEFEKESASWENGMTYEIEQEYYHWGELLTELEHFIKLSLRPI